MRWSSLDLSGFHRAHPNDILALITPAKEQVKDTGQKNRGDYRPQSKGGLPGDQPAELT